MAAQLSNARIMAKGTPQNILTELHITSNQYNLVTTMYYVNQESPPPIQVESKLTGWKIPYILAEAPSNLVVKLMRPSVWQARIMVRWFTVDLMSKSKSSRSLGESCSVVMPQSPIGKVSILYASFLAYSRLAYGQGCSYSSATGTVRMRWLLV